MSDYGRLCLCGGCTNCLAARGGYADDGDEAHCERCEKVVPMDELDDNGRCAECVEILAGAERARKRAEAERSAATP